MVAGNLCAAFAPNYGVLLAMRFVSGLPHGAYFGVGSIVAARVAGPGRSAQAVAVMIAGMTVANLFGVPLGTLVSHLLSWRALFCIAGVWGAVTAFFPLALGTVDGACGRQPRIEGAVRLPAESGAVAHHPGDDVR